MEQDELEGIGSADATPQEDILSAGIVFLTTGSDILRLNNWVYMMRIAAAHVDEDRLSQAHGASTKVDWPDVEPFVVELLFCRLVDRFQYGLFLLCRAMLKSKPELLDLTRRVPLGDLLMHGSVDELLGALAHEKAEGLSHSSKALLNTVATFFGAPVFDQKTTDLLCDMIEMRNCLVHRLGRIDEVFLDRRPGWAGRTGERATGSLDLTTLRDLQSFTTSLGRDLCGLAASAAGVDLGEGDDSFDVNDA